jgi:hypothetical protein
MKREGESVDWKQVKEEVSSKVAESEELELNPDRKQCSVERRTNS